MFTRFFASRWSFPICMFFMGSIYGMAIGYGLLVHLDWRQPPIIRDRMHHFQEDGFRIIEFISPSCTPAPPPAGRCPAPCCRERETHRPGTGFRVLAAVRLE